MEIVPKTGFKGLVENWQSDLIAALSVSLVAMPLSLGIAMASGVPPMAGVLSAIIGGVVTTFFRGSHVAINGPTAGLIAVILASLAALDFGDGKALNYVFAAIVISGVLQFLLGLLKMGKYADLFHSTVIHGILAAIGVIIIAKQIHVAMGTTSEADDIIDTLIDAFYQIPNINPFVGVISLLGLALLIFHSKISYKLFHFLPAPMWVLVISIPFVYIFNFFDARTVDFIGKTYELGPHLLVDIPNNILDAIAFPDFSKISTLPFWTSVISITLIASVESLASAKAVDKLDPYKRKTDLNKDLLGIGASTAVSGALGGLPIINVIVRSTVNVHNNAKTKWSNFYHGMLLLAFIFVLAPVIQKVPLCALAIILVYTGFKLASPSVFKHIYSQGLEQLLFFIGTLVITLWTDLLIGLFGGLLLAMVTHLLLAKVPPKLFLKMVFKPNHLVTENGRNVTNVQLQGIANFLGTIELNKVLEKIKPGSTVNFDLSKARLVDYSIMEHLYEFQRIHGYTGGTVSFSGLEDHISTSSHRLALKVQIDPFQRLTPRQIKLKKLADDNNWMFERDTPDHSEYFETFDFFKSRPIEDRFNRISSPEDDIDWEIVDLTFDEGAYESFEEYNTTLGIVKFDHKIPAFSIEKKTFSDKLFNFAGHKDIDHTLYENFSKKFIVKVENVDEMDAFINDAFRELMENSQVIHHLESNGESVLLFMDNMRLAHFRDYSKIVDFLTKLKAAVAKPVVL